MIDASKDATLPLVEGVRVRLRTVLLPAVGLTLLVLTWANRHALFVTVGELLVAEDSLERVDVVVISKASTAADALEAGRLYADGYGAEIVMPGWQAQPLAAAIRGLGIPYLGEGDLAAEILRRSGVPDSAVRILPGTSDGTESDIAAVATFARERQPTRVLFLTAKSHTARARWLLRRALPTTTRALVRAPRTDRFCPDSWWQSRDDSREVVEEYLRWFNTLILRDLWGGANTTKVLDQTRPTVLR